MKTPLLYKVYRTLRRGWKRLTPDAQIAVRAYVASQRTAHGFMNAGGLEDTYYTQFGEMLESVFTPARLLWMKIHLTVPESQGCDTVYGRFFDFLEREMRFWSRRGASETGGEECALRGDGKGTTNAICCELAMQYQMGKQLSTNCVEWLQQLQDETGGFRANEQAPIPDLLSTAAALFTLNLIDVRAKDATSFIQAHWLEKGGFAPTLFDDYTDVEYVFYGLLALGATRKKVEIQKDTR